MLGILALLIAVDAPVEAFPLPKWMVGCWQQRTDERWTKECWSWSGGPVMKGQGSSGTGKKTNKREVMQIIYGKNEEAEPWMSFVATPDGGRRTVFRWINSSDPGLTFVNESHDYPQRIRYWREGKELVAEIAMKDGSKAVSWRYKPIVN
jgi:hypothetical protein